MVEVLSVSKGGRVNEHHFVGRKVCGCGWVGGWLMSGDVGSGNCLIGLL